jgi:hypothetical protein
MDVSNNRAINVVVWTVQHDNHNNCTSAVLLRTFLFGFAVRERWLVGPAWNVE